MKRLLFLLVLSAVFLASALATPVDPCAANSLQYYHDNYGSGCAVGSNLLFTDFNGSPNPAIGLDDITVTPIAGGLRFSASWVLESAGDIYTLDNVVTFHVSATPGYALTAVNLSIAPATGGAGMGSVEETVTPGGVMLVKQNEIGSTLTDRIEFDPPVLGAGISKDIAVTTSFTGSPAAGLVHMSVVEQTFELTQTPEPGTMAMLGAGLLVVVTAARRRFSR